MDYSKGLRLKKETRARIQKVGVWARGRIANTQGSGIEWDYGAEREATGSVAVSWLLLRPVPAGWYQSHPSPAPGADLATMLPHPCSLPPGCWILAPSA